MRVLITGAAGFIGSQLAANLVREGHDVTLLDNLSFGHQDNLYFDDLGFLELEEMDVRDSRLATIMQGHEIVFHLAAVSSLPHCQENPVEAFSVNVNGTANALESARVSGVKRFVFASTSAVYENSLNPPFSELTPTAPTLTYSLSKAVSEDLINAYVVNYKLPAYVVRFFNVYGPHQDFLRINPPLMGYICRCLAQGEAPVFYSDGKQQRDYIFIDDVLSLLQLVISADDKVLPRGSTLNACSGTLASVLEIYELLSKHFVEPPAPSFEDSQLFWDSFPNLFQGHYPLDRDVISREVDKFSLGSSDAAYSALGWRASVSLEAGTRLVADFVKDNMPRFRQGV